MSIRRNGKAELESQPAEIPSPGRLAMLDGAASFRRLPDDFEETHLLNDPRDRQIGDLLREARTLTEDQIPEVLSYQREHGLRFGVAAIRLGYVSERDVLFALSRQFRYPYALDGVDNYSRELVVGTDPYGEQAETFRELRSQLLQGVLETRREGGRPALSLLSTNVGDGRSFFAANLAVAFGQLGGRTLLIDADMRTPRQHQIFNVESELGLSSVLAGRTKQRVIHRVSGIPSLYVMPVGIVPPNPLELVQGVPFSLLLREMSDKFDYVIVDTPAASHGADARVIASKTGAALGVARRNRSKVSEWRELTSKIARSNVKFAGIAINEY